ncbi:MAG: cytochrome c-type biogenesis protein [Hyphomonadaceae bacterium]
MKRIIAALALFAIATPSQAQPAASTFSPEVESAARQLGKTLRCVVCQNQSIEESGAPLAADMRTMVRERLAAGQREEQVIAYMTDRYGNFVLMKPPFQADTLVLWLGPLILAALAGWGWFAFLAPSARRSFEPPPLSEAEAIELDRALSKDRDT